MPAKSSTSASLLRMVKIARPAKTAPQTQARKGRTLTKEAIRIAASVGEEIPWFAPISATIGSALDQLDVMENNKNELESTIEMIIELIRIIRDQTVRYGDQAPGSFKALCFSFNEGLLKLLSELHETQRELDTQKFKKFVNAQGIADLVSSHYARAVRLQEQLLVSTTLGIHNSISVTHAATTSQIDKLGTGMTGRLDRLEATVQSNQLFDGEIHILRRGAIEIVSEFRRYRAPDTDPLPPHTGQRDEGSRHAKRKGYRSTRVHDIGSLEYIDYIVSVAGDRGVQHHMREFRGPRAWEHLAKEMHRYENLWTDGPLPHIFGRGQSHPILVFGSGSKLVTHEEYIHSANVTAREIFEMAQIISSRIIGLCFLGEELGGALDISPSSLLVDPFSRHFMVTEFTKMYSLCGLMTCNHKVSGNYFHGAGCPTIQAILRGPADMVHSRDLLKQCYQEIYGPPSNLSRMIEDWETKVLSGSTCTTNSLCQGITSLVYPQLHGFVASHKDHDTEYWVNYMPPSDQLQFNEFGGIHIHLPWIDGSAWIRSSMRTPEFLQQGDCLHETGTWYNNTQFRDAWFACALSLFCGRDLGSLVAVGGPMISIGYEANTDLFPNQSAGDLYDIYSGSFMHHLGDSDVYFFLKVQATIKDKTCIIESFWTDDDSGRRRWSQDDVNYWFASYGMDAAKFRARLITTHPGMAIMLADYQWEVLHQVHEAFGFDRYSTQAAEYLGLEPLTLVTPGDEVDPVAQDSAPSELVPATDEADIAAVDDEQHTQAPPLDAHSPTSPCEKPSPMPPIEARSAPQPFTWIHFTAAILVALLAGMLGGIVLSAKMTGHQSLSEK